MRRNSHEFTCTCLLGTWIEDDGAFLFWRSAFYHCTKVNYARWIKLCIGILSVAETSECIKFQNCLAFIGEFEILVKWKGDLTQHSYIMTMYPSFVTEAIQHTALTSVHIYSCRQRKTDPWIVRCYLHWHSPEESDRVILNSCAHAAIELI